MSIYYDEIHRRANAEEWKIALQNKTVTFKEWREHWITTAKKWKMECDYEGLLVTAKYIQEIIDHS